MDKENEGNVRLIQEAGANVANYPRTILGTRGNNSIAEDVDGRKTERRRKSLEMMHNSAQIKSIKDVYDDAIIRHERNHINEGTAIERFNLLLTKAKEKGMSVNNIYQFFSGETSAVSILSIDKFIANIEKLGFVSFEPDEIENIVKAISKNCDGMISLEEFKHYCYTEIESIPWKAERLRLEESGDMEQLKFHISRKISSGDSTHYCGDQVFCFAKYFLRMNASVEIRMHFCPELNVLTLQFFDQSHGRELPNLYIRINKHYPHIEEEVHVALKAAKNNYGPHDLTSLESRLRWSSIGKYLISILTMKELAIQDQSTSIASKPEYVPYISFPNGEYYDILSCKPVNMVPPPSILKAATMDEFHNTVASFNKEHRSARDSRISAEEYSSTVASLLLVVERADISGL